MSQLSLVFFTVLAQSAVGMFIALGLIELFFKPNNKAMTRSFMAVFVLLGVGAIASVTHLGQPFRMFNVMFGLAHGSALSLEIVGLSLFGGAAVAYTGMRLLDIMPAIRKVLLPVSMALYCLHHGHRERIHASYCTNVEHTIHRVPVPDDRRCSWPNRSCYHATCTVHQHG
ncbi:anaerobic dimethyl sulfoxide reductase chain C [Photobacterium aphoticum]|uniref:Anaerobic dimethyl sulfoxide reductase chain C n=1 Tax=Photobacterium aphoticum TaxID=754436 RepID=A0A090QP97_9GAMM|nr:anaerobic dimethyl sulfoxide reductase chain C [Photobacterium aphoticum]